MLNQATLKRLLFPLGRYTKDQIRDKANQLNLLNANRPDSQEICFVSQNRTETLWKAVWMNPIYARVILNILMAPCLGNIPAFITIPLGNVKGLIFRIAPYLCA